MDREITFFLSHLMAFKASRMAKSKLRSFADPLEAAAWANEAKDRMQANKEKFKDFPRKAKACRA